MSTIHPEHPLPLPPRVAAVAAAAERARAARAEPRAEAARAGVVGPASLPVRFCGTCGQAVGAHAEVLQQRDWWVKYKLATMTTTTTTTTTRDWWANINL